MSESNQKLREQILTVFEYRDGGLFRLTTGLRGYQRKDGYVYVSMNGRQYGEHRLVHLLFSGELPYQVDHVNGVRNDNRPENLRSATHAQNCANRKPMGKYGKGVYWLSRRKKWMVQVTRSGKRATVGYFTDHDEAKQAYAREAFAEYGEFARA